jgi:hypothetical protein
MISEDVLAVLAVLASVKHLGIGEISYDIVKRDGQLCIENLKCPDFILKDVCSLVEESHCAL